MLSKSTALRVFICLVSLLKLSRAEGDTHTAT